MLRSWPARDGSAGFGGSANCSSWRARSGGRSLSFGCRCPTGACHAAPTVEGCRDAGDCDVGVSCAKASLAASVRIAAHIAASRMRILLSARNVSIEREFRFEQFRSQARLKDVEAGQVVSSRRPRKVSGTKMLRKSKEFGRDYKKQTFPSSSLSPQPHSRSLQQVLWDNISKQNDC